MTGDHPPGQFRGPVAAVVTFNAQQRDFIESLLRDTGHEQILTAIDNDSEGPFVKTFENVQGHDRDRERHVDPRRGIRRPL